MKRTLSLLSVLFLGISGCSDQPLAPEIELTPDATSSAIATAHGITITSIEGPTDPVAVNTPVQITADFAGASGDTHTGVIRWGDGASTVATITEADGAGTAIAGRSYVLPGVYTVEVEISNQNAESVLGTHEYITVYDPDGGYVSGNGAILSPPNACTWSGCVADEGAARFGFSSRYRNGATVPDGNTRFTFRDGNFTFSSTEYDWLVIAGARAQYKGVGTVNRQGNYGFMLTAIDSDRAGGGEEDRFRIKIWDQDDGDVVVYDNQAGEGDDADLTADGTRLTRGSITVRSTTRNEAPVVIITSPTDGATVLETDGILLSADAGDAEDGDISESVAWSSDVAGELGMGAELTDISLAPGTHTIAARVTDSGGLEASASVVVDIAEVTISVSPTTATISEGETQQFTATVYADGVEMLSGAPTVSWNSSNENVATADSDGLASAMSEGETTITASAGPVSGSAALSVSAATAAASWHQLGGGVGSNVLALAEHAGGLIVGGSFNYPDMRHIIHWTGTEWQTLGNGLQSHVWAITTFDGDLIAGGSFNTAQGEEFAYIARWDGFQWQTLGAGMNGTVRALAVYEGDLIAGGSFTTADGQTANYIARWDGFQWQPMGAGMNASVFALAVHDGDLVAGGEFTTADGQAANRIARWNGSQWQRVGTGMNDIVRALVVHDGDLIAGGYFTRTWDWQMLSRIARWDGAQWHPLGAGVNNFVHSLTVHDGDLIVGGDFTMADGQAVNRIARWNASQWQPMGSGMNAGVYALMAYDGDLIAGGRFTIAGDEAANRIARWGPN